MRYAQYPFVPGPTTLHPAVLQAMAHDYGSGLVERDCFALYSRTVSRLQQVLGTANPVVLMTGEGMIALWGALKSCLRPGDKVLCVGTGVFGDGIAPMAESIGCTVQLVSLPHDSTIDMPGALEKVEEAMKQFQPKMITAVHCETPSGTLNPIQALGALKKRYNVPLFYVDAVASAGGVPVEGDAAHVDLLLVGSQKCFSAPPSMSMLGVSEVAWEAIEDVGYQGYDALLPFKNILQDGVFPYTPYWHGIAALDAAVGALLDEGLPQVYARHESVAAFCRRELQDMGMTLFPVPGANNSPTVTAAYIPSGHTWESWQGVLRQEGVIVASTYGAAEGKVFRVGHMGVQADMELMRGALKIMRQYA